MLITHQVVEEISACKIFKNIDLSTLTEMMSCLNPSLMSYEKNETIVSAGDPFTGIGLVVEGEVLVTQELFTGERSVMTTLTKNAIFGEVPAFVKPYVWPATVVSRTNSRILFISPEKAIKTCRHACSGHKQLIENILEIIAYKALNLNRKIAYLSIRTLRGKLSAYLLSISKMKGGDYFEIEMNRQELADFFNVARPSLSRELSKMKEEGLIDFDKNLFKILKKSELEKYI